jgi:hypothetical protein
LAVTDPLADMAEPDPEKLAAVLAEIETESEALQAMLDELAAESNDEQSEPDWELPPAPPSVEENVQHLAEIRRMREKGNQNVQERNDTECYLVVVYADRAEREAAVQALGLPKDERYISADAITLRIRSGHRPTPTGRTAAKAKDAGACG